MDLNWKVKDFNLTWVQLSLDLKVLANKRGRYGEFLGFSKILVFILYFFVFLGPHSWHLEVPRLGVKSELQLPAYAMDTATWDPRCICDLCRSLG